MNKYLLIFLLIPFNVLAHEGDHGTWTPQIMPAANLNISNQVAITEENGKRVIRSNGIPDHSVGTFPNRSNPNSISAQSHVYRIPLQPVKNASPRKQDKVMGIALNGVPIEPGTAECYGRSRGQRGPMSSCDWREEAIINGKGRLGLDMNNAHVQPTGAYHYHGVPHGLLNQTRGRDLVHIGYALDGFEIYASRSDSYKSSYRLKSGSRASGPGGRYDGTYTADFEYVSGSGDLDECNGKTLDGRYVYFMTESFPFAPRCLWGNAERQARSGGAERGGYDGRRPPPRHMRH